MNLKYSRYMRQLEQELRAHLYKADLDIPVSVYIKYSILSCIILSLLATLMISTFSFDPLTLFLIFILLFIAFFLISKNIPITIAKARAAEIESDLPIAIRSIGIQLNMKVPFEKAIENIANSNYKCSGEFRKAVNMIDSGTSIPDALRKIAERVDSQTVKKLVVQLIHVYLEGMDGTELKHSADELINAQRFKFKEFSAKLSFLSLMFIAVSSIAPTMYLAYLVVAGTYLETPTSASDIWFAFLFIFPLINIILILYIKYSTPPVLSNISEKFLSEREMIILNEQLKNFGFKLKFKQLMIYLSLLSLAAALILYLFIGGYSLVILALPLVVYFAMLWSVEKRANEIEQHLPDALLYAATLELGMPMEKIVENIGDAGYGPLSDEFKKAGRQIKIGISVSHALLNMKDRNNSLLLDRVISLLIQCYKTGRDVHKAIKETAEDIFELNMLKKEQASSLALQKYTILLGGGIFVPIIMSVILNIIYGIQPIDTNVASVKIREEILNVAYQAIQVYLVIYVLLSSLFVAMQEGRMRTFIGYFLLLLPVSLILFTFGKDFLTF
ncbi:MAG: type II secretion system F family protein [Candidatus Micrarchaeota archaeon]|nr:type II secretion system F family protein [Candidatus Micrarchaeota archaeon]